MVDVMRALFLTLFGIAIVACSSAQEKQWYRPGGSYTVADFQRDEKACTKNRELDEECLKGLGWVPLSVEGRPAPTSGFSGARGGGKGY
jgi:hypothetical protein